MLSGKEALQRRKELAEKKARKLAESYDRGKSAVVTGFFSMQCEVLTPEGEQLRLHMRRTLRDKPVVGDLVIAKRSGDRGILETILPRENVLSRLDERGRKQLLAANIDNLIITSSIEPVLKERLIDRYLVLAHNQGINPMIVLNKIDLPEKEHETERVSFYRGLGYPVYLLSALTNEKLDEFRSALEGKKVFLVGQSGVGKSTIINSLIPGLDITVGDVSEHTHKGKHTTSSARAYRFGKTGLLIDTPGIRSFALHGIEPLHVQRGFIEIVEFSPGCSFDNCLHVDEPDCAVRSAVESGEITESRYDSYLRILDSILNPDVPPV
jgi:ribosome biogenesis GTPase